MTAIDQTGVKPPRRTVLASIAGLLCVACAGTAVAGPDLVALNVVDRETGQVLRTYAHHGRLYVAGQPGARYGLRVRNLTSGRVMVVLSVDGVNIVTGETADYGQNGYVLDPWSSYDLNGWRKSQAQIAAFAFAPQGQSYAARTGRPTDVGVIGMAVFRERAVIRRPIPMAPPILSDRFSEDNRATSAAPPPPRPPIASPSAKSSWMARGEAGGADMAQDQAYADAPAAPEDKLGTAHGAREWSVSNSTTFERATRYPQSLKLIEYDTWANLVAIGVIPRFPPADHRPRPFPANPDQTGFVPDPPPEP